MSSLSDQRTLRPAIRRGKQITIGNLGDSHEDVLSRQRDYPRNLFDSLNERGFATKEGSFLNRSEAFKYARKYRLIKDNVEEWETELQSDHLRSSSLS